MNKYPLISHIATLDGDTRIQIQIQIIAIIITSYRTDLVGIVSRNQAGDELYQAQTQLG